MATSFSVEFWLKSLELAQYVEHFKLHFIETQEQCLHLDEEKLCKIGVAATGHQRRILNHLPTDKYTETSQNPDTFVAFQNPISQSFQPALPKKEKSARDSFLFRDDQPIYGNDDVHIAGTKNEPGYINFDKSTPKPKPAPRPVPRPRRNKMKNDSDSNATGKPEPVRRPTPAPRKSPSPTSASTPTSSISNEASIKFDIDGVCETETSTDDILELYSKPLKNVKADKLPSPCLNDDIQGQTPDFDTVYVSGDEGSLNSLDERLDSGKIHAFSDTKFENAEFDPLSGAYSSKLSSTSQDTKFQFAHELEGNLEHKNKDSGTKETDNQHEESETINKDDGDDIYEPIWGQKKVEKKEDSVKHKLPLGSVRKSNLIDFSPFPKTAGFEFPNKDASPESTVVNKRLSMLTTSGDRESGSFDLPPPEFPPPPLPQSEPVDESVLSDFDPLATPVIPPRPNKGSTHRSFHSYENVSFPTNADSPTLPPQLNEEPDIYQGESSPVPPPRHKGVPQGAAVSHDIFENIDPFGEFKPTDPDTDFDADMLASPFKSPKKPEKLKVELSTSDSNAAEGPVYEVAQDDVVYEVATEGEAEYEAIEEDFDPFGLKKEMLSRKISNTSTGSNKGLNEVVPAPNWAEITGMDRMYSFAGEMDDTGSSGSNDDLLDEEQDGMNTVQVLPTTVYSPRKTERSGYLYKQGGIKQNRGWRKRWVIFDGKSLRYYSNQKTQVSKRVVPLSCMKKVEIDVKDVGVGRPQSTSFSTVSDFFVPANNRQFKFQLHCTNRTFLFATDTLDDCQMWSQTLMAAIIKYETPEGGEIPGGEMVNPDIADWIRFDKRRSKFYVALKENMLCYYQNMDDYYMASPIHEIDMKLASVKEIERTKLQLRTHYTAYLFNFDSSSDASNWKMAIEESISCALGDDKVLNQVKEANPANAVCADCKAKDAHWASMNLAIVLCLKCAGIHRGFDLRLSKVRSLRMDCRIWNSSLLEMFKVIGNDNSNRFWNWKLPHGSQIDENTPLQVRKEHIHNKYKNKLYCDLDPLSTDKESLNEALLAAAQTDDVLLTLKILYSGADVLYHRPGEPDTTAFELAKEAHQRIQMEFLLQNGGDKTQNFTPGTEEEALVAKLRSEVQHQGYLQKTGPNMKDFLKRWCVLEHGHLSYYLDEESKVEKDRIENDTIQCIQAVSANKNPHCIEISCSKRNASNRVYLFSAASTEDRLQWLRKISQVFCPVSLMDHVKDKVISLAGYVFIKFGFNAEWQKSWILLENRTLYYTDKNNTEGSCDSVDLRKVTSLVKIAQVTSACDTCLEIGPQFALHVPEKALYFQADLVRDTERMFHLLQTTAKQGGDTLEDQLLNTNNVPIIVHSCIDFIEDNGMRLKGIYREAAQNSKVQAILDKYKEDARAVVLKMEDHTVHEVCNALKRFLRNLSDPLLTAELYSQWLDTAGKSHMYNMLDWYRHLLHQLPRTNYLTLKCIAAHLWKLSKHSSENMMTLDNISIAFGSTLMKSATAEGSATVADVNAGKLGNSMQLEMKVISDIVTHYEELFGINEAEDRQRRIEDEIRKAQEKMKDARASVMAPNNEIMVEVYNLSPEGNSEMVKISPDSTVNDVLSILMDRWKKSSSERDNWALHEIVRKELERPLHSTMKVWPLIHEWQNWSREYSAQSCLCVKSNELSRQIENAYDPSKPLFGDFKYAEKKKFAKGIAIEFTQSRLSIYKDSKNLNSPIGSWNIEDLSIYKGNDSRRTSSPPTKFTFTFLKKGEQVNKPKSDLAYFGRTVCCSSENELMSWLAGMLIAQNGGRWS